MKKIISVSLMGLVLLLASCSLNVMNDLNDTSSQGETVNGVLYANFNGFDIIEHRILIGYDDRSAAEDLVKRLGGEIYLEIPQIKVLAVRIPMKVEEAFKTLKAMKFSGIRYIEPSYKRELIDPKPGVVDDQIVRSVDDSVDEEFWGELWGLQKINAKSAWDAGYTGNGVVVAVVDTPIDCQHPDLSGQCVTGYDPELGTEIAPDADYEDPLNPNDDHGTHVAGTIAAKKDGQGVVGLAYNAKIMSIVIFKGTPDHSDYDYGGDEYVANGIIWAVDHGAKVLSNSWGGGGYSYTLKEAIDYALKSGAVFVAAAGNGHTDQHWHYPSAYPGVIAVAASTARDDIVDFSNRGDYISVAAPGVNILSSIPHLAGYGVYGRPYDYWGGTSMATPHVSALVALLLEKYPDATPYQIKKMIEESAFDIEESGWDHSAGYGRIDVAAALEKTPESYSGTDYYVVVKSKDGGFGIPAALITLKRKSGEGSDYYAATNGAGVAEFHDIDPGEYDVIVGGPDLFEITSPILRMEEATGTSYSVNLSSGESTDTVEFDTNIIFQFNVIENSIFHFILASSYYLYGEFVDLGSFDIPGSYSVRLLSGQVIAMYEIENPATTTITVSATAIVNDHAIPIWGTISPGSTYTFLDERGGIPLWWTAF